MSLVTPASAATSSIDVAANPARANAVAAARSNCAWRSARESSWRPVPAGSGPDGSVIAVVSEVPDVSDVSDVDTAARPPRLDRLATARSSHDPAEESVARCIRMSLHLGQPPGEAPGERRGPAPASPAYQGGGSS